MTVSDFYRPMSRQGNNLSDFGHLIAFIHFFFQAHAASHLRLSVIKHIIYLDRNLKYFIKNLLM